MPRNAKREVAPSGWISWGLRCPSPHYNERPEGTVIDALIIHCISLPAGVFGNPNIKNLFLGQLDTQQDPSFESLKNLRVSSHFVIDRTGEITQYVSCHDRAWHAGVSSLQGRDNCNDFSIGIELEGADQIPYTDLQYTALIELTQVLLTAFPAITPDRIVGHCHIAPSRKTDPGPAFDWARYQGALCFSSKK